MKKRVAIIGFGNDAKHYYNELRRSEYFELAAIFDGVQNSETTFWTPYGSTLLSSLIRINI